MKTTPESSAEVQGSQKTRRTRTSLHVVVLVVGIVITAALTVTSQISYVHNEQHLTKLQTQLTGDTLGITQVDIERRLGQALALASESPHEGTEFADAIASSMTSKGGPFTRATLRLVNGSTVSPSIVSVGSSAIINSASKTSLTLYKEAAKTKSLITARILGKGQQRLSYLLSIKTPKGQLVAGASQSLPSNHRVPVAQSSPYADLNFAIYFGPKIVPDQLIESTVSKLPLTGTVAHVEVPYGSNVITVVTSAKGALSGKWSEFIPWGILIAGLILTLAGTAMTSRLEHRRRRAEELNVQVIELYQEQRRNSEELQRGLLPKKLPQIAGVEFAGLYLSGTEGLEVGGDWYSAIRVDDDRFAFVVGDVSGRGVRAATLMASLRYTARAFASIGYEPSEILKMAGREIDIEVDQHFATVLVGFVDNAKRELTLASAGHLLPLFVHDGKAEFIEIPVGVPLGISSDGYEQVTVSIPKGAMFLGYTDGLIERRGSDLTDQMELLRTAAPVSDVPAQKFVDAIVDQFAASAANDDIAMLAMKWTS